MKCLTIIVDDRELFAGEVAEITWNETGEQVSVTGRFKTAPSFLESLQAVAKRETPASAPVAQLSQSDSLDHTLVEE